MRAFTRLLLDHKAAAYVAIAISLGCAAYAAYDIPVRFQFRDFYDYPTNPNLSGFKQHSDQFGDPAGAVVLLAEAADVFEPSVLRYIGRLTEALEPDPRFSRVDSLANVPLVDGTGGVVTTEPLLVRLEAEPADRERLRRMVVNSPLLRRRLVSEDASVTAVQARLATPADLASIDEQRAAIAAGERALAEHPPPPGVRVRVTGAPLVEVETTGALLRDQAKLVPMGFAVLLLALLAMFRSVHGVLLPVLTISAAMVWTAGFFALLGRPVDLLVSCVPALLLVYGVVDSVFVLSRYLEKLAAGCAREHAIVETQCELALPCFLTSLTTSVGFATFTFSPLPTMHALGLSLAVGVAFAWVTTVTLLPLLLATFPAPKVRISALDSFRWVDTMLVAICNIVRRRTPAILLGTLVLIIVGGVVGSRQRIVNSYIDQLPASDVRATIRDLEQKLSGVMRLVIYLQADPGAMRRADVVRAIDDIDHRAEKEPGVATSISLADLLAVQHAAFSGDSARTSRLPVDDELIAQYLELLARDQREDFASADFAQSQIPVFVEDQGSASLRALANMLQRQATAAFEPLGVRASVTGSGLLGYIELDRVVSDMLLGFGLAFTLIVALQWILLRSARLALISLVPNAIPFVICMATISALGVGLSFDTSLVLCVAIGGLFNTTIHFSARMIVGAARNPAMQRDELTLEALRAIGPPAFFTTFVLSLGMLVLTTSDFSALRNLGALSLLTLLAGFFSDAIVTSALMRTLFRVPSRLPLGYRAERDAQQPPLPTVL